MASIAVSGTTAPSLRAKPWARIAASSARKGLAATGVAPAMAFTRRSIAETSASGCCASSTLPAAGRWIGRREPGRMKKRTGRMDCRMRM